MTANTETLSEDSGRPDGAAPMLQMRDIGIEFHGVVALDGVDLEILPGEVHGLLGENGAGKSTLIKILSGLYRASRGRILINGSPVSITSPAAAADHGIHVIHQDRQLVPTLTVAESLYLGRDEDTAGPWLNRRALQRRATRDIHEHLGVSIPGGALIGELSVAEQQLVQIARAVMAAPSVLILDEPTAPLAHREVDRLFGIIGDLKARGISMIYISHYLDEIRRTCDRVTVLRNGRNASVMRMADTTLERIVQAMIGRDVEEFPERPARIEDSLVRLRVSNLISREGLDGVSFEVAAGEIVGVTGLIGSGADKLGKALFGLAPASGLVEIEGRRVARRTPRRMTSLGVGFVPADRRGEGVVTRMSIAENITMSALSRFTRFGLLNRRAEAKAAQESISRLSVVPSRMTVATRDLSGGNQQKVVLAKWLVAKSKIFILDQPTSGVDIGSRAAIYDIISALAAEGAAVLVITQDLSELVGLSDRILVMYRGSIRREYSRGEATDGEILAASTGADVAEVAA
ncbi:sugar ABC transporter ATP-binding protein [Streptomyces sp. NPDC000880]